MLSLQNNLSKTSILNLSLIKELGWDRYDADLDVVVEGKTCRLTGIAHKRGMAVLRFSADGLLPEYSLRRKIERQVTRSAHEHIIIFTDKDQTLQIWQWVKREPGKPLACREHHYNRSQSGEALIQKLDNIVFSLDEEEQTSLIDVTSRARATFDVERVTKKFYDRFKAEHTAFLKFLKGIPDEELQRWYASVMINRLMFIYFIQKKGFLNGDRDYLHNKLKESKHQGKDQYYKEFLCPLFFEGFAKSTDERSAAMNKLFGFVPYLNGGLFLKHQIEEVHGKTIQVADAAFEKLFTFFEQYQWHLDERPTRKDDEINPDILGYIFEKYINQKQMGAYYTKEDITEYIGKNTIIPFLFDEAKKKCKIAFEGEHSIWTLLQNDPDRYIYDAVKHGVSKPLPSEIAQGIDTSKPKLIDRRAGWNKSAPEEYALPTEIWREVVARRKRYEEVRAKLAAGEIRDINDLITYNLNIRQFAQDVIETCEGPDLLNAFWHAIEKVTVLDPTCGSGAFLFAALNILEPLYEACIERMEIFLGEWGEKGKKLHPNYYKLFDGVHKRLEQHPNQRYFILKSIIINNLYGVDIMEEATEICKLRLFLKLVAQIDDAKHIEPLPDIDFNIRAGNTLVGFATYKEVEHVVTSKLDFGDAMKQIKEAAEDLDRLFKLFRQQQTELGGTVTAKDKAALQAKLKKLEEKLNRYLGDEYGVGTKKGPAYDAWLKSHKPFHWFIEFYGIMDEGGFDIIIGNPPFVEMKDVDYMVKGLRSLETDAIHAMCVERSLTLASQFCCMSMVFPMSLVSTQRMNLVQKIIERNRSCWYANFAWRPAKLFDTVNRAISIFVTSPSSQHTTYSTGYTKWVSDDRDNLIPRLGFAQVNRVRDTFWVPKFSSEIESRIVTKLLDLKTTIARFIAKTKYRVYYRTTGGLYWKVFTDFAPAFRINGRVGHSSRETWFSVSEQRFVGPLIACLSSDVFWWWYTLSSNLRDLNPSDILNFPISEKILNDQNLAEIGARYLHDIAVKSMMLVREQKQTGRTETQSFKIQLSMPIIDEIDRVLAEHYGFTEEELDFIINYDIKYRMGKESAEEME